jgi:hypothetical protein
MIPAQAQESAARLPKGSRLAQARSSTENVRGLSYFPSQTSTYFANSSKNRIFAILAEAWSGGRIFDPPAIYSESETWIETEVLPS